MLGGLVLILVHYYRLLQVLVQLIWMKSGRILVCVSRGLCLDIWIRDMMISTSLVLHEVRSIDYLVSMRWNISFLRIVLLRLLIPLLWILLRLPRSFLYILESFLNRDVLLAVDNWFAITWRKQIKVACGPWTHAWRDFFHALTIIPLGAAQARCRQSVWGFGRSEAGS